MKILFDHPMPFSLSHGGLQIQVAQTKRGLEQIGVETEHLRWWDDAQRGDLIHYFGLAPYEYLEQARTRKLPVVMTNLFTDACNRPKARLRRQAFAARLLLALPLGEGNKRRLPWRVYNHCDLNVLGLEAERKVMELVYQVPPEKIALLPLGLSETYLEAGRGTRNESHLICTGTITSRKNCVELAQMAVAAKTPILFVGKPYSTDDPYWKRFSALIDNTLVKYRPHVDSEQEMAGLLKSARGFVLMSDYENWCLSAHEAIACGLPVLVQDQNWSRECFGEQVRYFKTIGANAENIEILRRFYAEAPNLPAPAVKIRSWKEVAGLLKPIYERVLSTSR